MKIEKAEDAVGYSDERLRLFPAYSDPEKVFDGTSGLLSTETNCLYSGGNRGAENMGAGSLDDFIQMSKSRETDSIISEAHKNSTKTDQMIAIIDYGGANFGSVQKALNYLGVNSVRTSSPNDIEQAEKIIFPGVGSFGPAMDNLKKKGLDVAIKESIESGKPYLGICLGLQTLFESSEESPGTKGLGVFKGSVSKFRQGKIPHVGWNVVKPKKTETIEEGHAYFVHSYYAVPEDESVVAGTTDYYVEFASAVERKNVLAVQFHLEKSGKVGLELLRRWLQNF